MTAKTMDQSAYMFAGDFRIVVFAKSLQVARRMLRQDFRGYTLKYIGRGQPSQSDAHRWIAANIMNWR